MTGHSEANPISNSVLPPSANLPTDVAKTVDAVRALARASRLLERASGELNLAHYRVLSAIAAGDQRASRVASRLAIGKPTISATVESLCQRGLLVRSRAQGDQRVATLELTAAGERVLAVVEAAMVERIVELCDRTPDREQFLQALVWLGAAIDEVVTDHSAANNHAANNHAANNHAATKPAATKPAATYPAADQDRPAGGR